MPTSVKLDAGSKDLLERLQADIKLETGRKVSQQELLTRLIERGYESRADLIDSYRDDFDGLSEDEIGQWLSGTSDWGMETTEGEIDEILYDREPLSEFDDE